MGGILGILLGVGISKTITYYANMPTYYSPVSIIAALLISSFVGVLFGTYPAWKAAQQYPAQPGADATGAILYAAMGDADKTAELINRLKEKFPAWVAQTQQMTQQILSGTHPAFPK